MKRLWLLIICAFLVMTPGTGAMAQAPGDSPLPTPTVTVVSGDGGDIPAVGLSGPGLAAIAALLLSLAVSYIPGFSAFWSEFAHKRELLAGVGLVEAMALVGLHYAGAINLGLGAFGWPVVWRVIESWLAFAGAGQLAFTGERMLSGNVKDGTPLAGGGSDAGAK